MPPCGERTLLLLEKALAHLHYNTFYYKLKKCSFLYNCTIFLGFDVTPIGMFISDAKVQSLYEWPVPITIEKLQSLLGFIQYF